MSNRILATEFYLARIAKNENSTVLSTCFTTLVSLVSILKKINQIDIVMTHEYNNHCSKLNDAA